MRLEPLFALLPAIALAAPAAPVGWRLEADGTQQVYRLSRDDHVAELRLLPAEASTDSLDAWFFRRMTAPLGDGAAAQWRAATANGTSGRLVTGTGRDAAGRALQLVRAGCRRPQGGFVFADVRLSDDAAFVRAQLPLVAKLIADACVEGASDDDEARALGREKVAAPPAVGPGARGVVRQDAPARASRAARARAASAPASGSRP